MQFIRCNGTVKRVYLLICILFSSKCFLNFVAFIYNFNLSVLFIPIYRSSVFSLHFSGLAIFAFHPLALFKNFFKSYTFIIYMPRLTVASPNRRMILTVGAGPSWAPAFGLCSDSSCCCCGSCCLHDPCDPRSDSLTHRPSQFTRGQKACQSHYPRHGRRGGAFPRRFFSLPFLFFFQCQRVLFHFVLNAF